MKSMVVYMCDVSQLGHVHNGSSECNFSKIVDLFLFEQNTGPFSKIVDLLNNFVVFSNLVDNFFGKFGGAFI